MKDRWIKLLVLFLFVAIIAVSAYYMYTHWVVKSPYHKPKYEQPAH